MRSCKPGDLPVFPRCAATALLACSRLILAWGVSASVLPVDCFPNARWVTTGVLAIFLRLPLLSRIISNDVGLVIAFPLTASLDFFAFALRTFADAAAVIVGR